MNLFKGLTVRRPNIALRQFLWDFSRRATSNESLVNVIENGDTGTANIVLQRPPVNSLNLELLDDIKKAVQDLEKKKFKGFIVSSSSPSVFCAGLDIMELYRIDVKRFRVFWRSLQETMKCLYQTPLVTVAAVNGHAPAGGCMLALSCDYRVMVNGKGTIGMNEVLLGIAAPQWFQKAMINTIGYREAEKALMLGSLFPPEKALMLGMVDELALNSDDLRARATARLSSMLKLPTKAYQATKLGLRKPFVDELSSYQDKEIGMMEDGLQSHSVINALGKYFEDLRARKS